MNYSIYDEGFFKSLFESSTEFSSIDFPETQWHLKWASNHFKLLSLFNAIRSISPQTIVETGTFEGHGTIAMAHAAPKSCEIITIDYDGDPKQDSLGTVSNGQWSKLAQIRTQNLDYCRASTGVRIRFLNGDSREMLKTFDNDFKWDFWYQDSMHNLEGITSEWNLMEQYAVHGSIVVLDDIRSLVVENWFRQNVADHWDVRRHGKQLWVQKRERPVSEVRTQEFLKKVFRHIKKRLNTHK